MDVFKVHEQVLAEYRKFTSGFVDIRDRRIRDHIDQQLNDGVQWPDPWLSLNPSFASGGSIPDLVRSGLLHPETERIFRRKTDRQDPGRDPIVLHQHQRDAVEIARTGESYVLTTGTGSGKSLAYIVPIVDAVLRERDENGGKRRPGVKAIVVYPMNALANSQVGELEKYLSYGYPPDGEPVTFKRYTGQESQDERRRILADPPDILLTNYVMLELVLTRPDERRHLVRAAQNLRFLALDEVHTYRGRQGADVAMLIRRLRDQCSSGERLQVIGTSATMSSQGSIADQRAVVAEVATRLFGAMVTADRVVGETLIRGAVLDAGADLPQATAQVINGMVPADYESLAKHPLASWIETTFGLDVDPVTGRLIRRLPTTIPKAALELAQITGHSIPQCEDSVRRLLRAGSRLTSPTTTLPLFAFRLHQFVSKGDTVYVSLEPEDQRHITSAYQVSVPHQPEKALLPLGFCRECGQEYMVVAKVKRNGRDTFVSRRDADASGGDSVTGYMYVSADYPWPENPLTAGALPESWLVTDPQTGVIEVTKSKQKYLPDKVFLNSDGTLDPTGLGLPAWFISTPFAFCLRCRVSYEQVRGADFGKLATLDAEGRSSAVTLLSGAIIRSLRGLDADQLDRRARKLLTFVDNRQDASLQAGHLNDFVQVAQLRSALFHAARSAGSEGLSHEDIAPAVVRELKLELADFAASPEVKFSAKSDAERSLRAAVEYQLYVDLQRGWRVTMPNLEQTGLLKITYRDLPELAADEDTWAGSDDLAALSPERREEVARILLDEFRRVRAVAVDALTDDGFDRIKRLTRTHLREPWSMGEDDRIVDVGVGINRPVRAGGRRSVLGVTGRGAFGKYLQRESTGFGAQVTAPDADRIIDQLFGILTRAGLLVRTDTREGPTYQLNAGALRWRAGDGEHGAADPLRREFSGEESARVNPFFRDLYRELADGYAGLVAREHTAQVPQHDRQQREADFGAGTLPLLYCSPTMELGVDISDLNAVGMRNVPPTPANYAQRSGRAGRSGQQALVLTYCSSGNAHDSYWFRRSREMVAGSVIAPRLDLANEDLIRSHVHAMWLAETDQSLHSSITELIETSESAGSPLRPMPAIWSALNDPEVTRRATLTAGRVLAELRSTWALDGGDPDWWHDGWVYDQVTHAAAAFDDAFDRWRTLYDTALTEYHEQHRLAINTSASKWDRMQADRRRADARNQLALLRNEDQESGSTDFYSYRYLASEGFLPGYSFPRLPLAAYIPARRGPKAGGDYLQRPRFVAISEFGPGALIYHEGARYEVTRIQLPRDPGSTVADGTVTEAAKRCADCGYHHPIEAGADLCEHCGSPLGPRDLDLLRLSTVFTRRRERISSDEEERRRSGYELELSFRFADRGDRAGSRTSIAARPGHDPLLELIHGDAAVLRIANVGRRRRKNPHERGYWLDLREGTWLSDKQATDQPVDADFLTTTEDVRYKSRVVPFVQDQRNILLIRLMSAVEEPVAITLRTALERGMEASFQLEDSELDARALPDHDHRGRMLLTEAAEGGAGVLRRIVTEPYALATVARRALEIIHYDPDTGQDRDHADGARERCERGCYDCLLAYSNQYEHASIDRHSVVPLLLDLLQSEVTAGAGGRGREPQAEWLGALSDSGLERRFVDWLSDHGYRLPDDAQLGVEGANARPDFVYRLPGNPVAIFIDGQHHDDPNQRDRDEAAAERLDDAGWTVIRIRYDDDWPELAGRYRWLFGEGKSTR